MKTAKTYLTVLVAVIGAWFLFKVTRTAKTTSQQIDDLVKQANRNLDEINP